MSNKAVFTIVAKNYYGFAQALFQSIKRHNSNFDFYIIISDEIDIQEDFVSSEYVVREAKSLGIPRFSELAFKYNITELSTAIKPYVFSYLFEIKEYERAIYFDPDIYLYNSLDVIFEKLNQHDIVITPHFVTPELISSANAPETLTLFAGIYNLGFIAIKNSEVGRNMIHWWENRLHKYCYADKFDALHVDQKWIDFVPALYGDKVLIVRDLGWNIAYWNIHEREINNEDGKILVRNRILAEAKGDELLFIHFSGFNVEDIYFNKQCPTLVLENYPDWIPFNENYKTFLGQNHFNKFFHKEYNYSVFQNGQPILAFHRRIFRRLIDNAVFFENPFGTSGNTFYAELEAAGLISNSSINIDKLNERNYGSLDSKINKLNVLMRLLKFVLGVDKYVLLLKFCQRYFRPENQVFLIRKYSKIGFYNENIKRK